MVKRPREDSIVELDVTESTDNIATVPVKPQKCHAANLLDRSKTRNQVICSFLPHEPISFQTQDEFEAHYQQYHTNRCNECSNNLPSPHLLGLHIAENHDPFIALKRERGERTYECFVEGCNKVCTEWKKRRSHLVDRHGFPRNFDFLIVNNGIDGRRSLLRS